MTIVLGALLIGAIGFAYSGIYDVAASTPHSGLVNWYLSTVSHSSIERHAREVSVPDLTKERLIRAGINDFDAMCADCHGAPGRQPSATGLGLNPQAPDLAESAQHMNAAELFWVTKNGIRMTGMPAWGVTHEDDAIWPVVAFLQTLPDLTGERYLELLASAQGVGHHAAPDEHDHGDSEAAAHAGEDSAEEDQIEQHDDGHDHQH